ncbi:serine/threonine-protein kinase [Streptomyces sp. NPDC001568]|uniref:serine/threonine-protein kinase n=1 Tax=Streptomyces sp. NPDC001568 TaxID=3364588 RepID=UPI0036AABA08
MEQLRPADPHHIGPYRLLCRLGAGGMGQVYLARSDRGRTVAVKLVHPALARHEQFRSRFRHEVAAARRVGGAWTAPVLDADTEADVPWFASGYIAGPSLRQAVSHDFGPLPPRTVRILASGLARALQDIHRAGLIHRDLKPSNVLLTVDGPRIIDFGIARPPQRPPGDPDAGLTRTGELIGSPGFMAPEQVLGGPVTPACDVFCLGAILAYAATDRLPFGDARQPGGGPGLLLRIIEAEPDLDGVPAQLRPLVAACLHKDPAARADPAEVLARVGAGDTAADGRVPEPYGRVPEPDGRAPEPWLPAPLVAQLGRHAAQLLDREHGGPDRAPLVTGEQAGAEAGAPWGSRTPSAPGPRTPGDPGDPGDTGHPGDPRMPDGRARIPQAAPLPAPMPPLPVAPAPVPSPEARPAARAHEPPTAASSSGAGAGAGAGAESGSRPHLASTVFLLAVAVVVAVAAGGSVYAVMNGEPERPSPAPAPTASVVRPGPQSAPPTGSRGADPAEGPRTLPKGYTGTWRATHGSSTWHLTLAPGAVGDPVMTLRVENPGYVCSWRATLRKAPDPVELDASTVAPGSPPTCTSGSRSRLRLLPDRTLRRELEEASIPPLTYHRE